MTPALLNPLPGSHLEHWQSVGFPGQSSPSIPLLDCPRVRSGMNLRLRWWAGENAAKARSCLSALMCVLPWLFGLATQSYGKNGQLAIYWLD